MTTSGEGNKNIFNINSNREKKERRKGTTDLFPVACELEWGRKHWQGEAHEVIIMTTKCKKGMSSKKGHKCY